MRWLVVLPFLFAACKKKEAEPEPTTTTPSSGRSVTKVGTDDPEPDPNAGSAPGSAVAAAPADAAAAEEAPADAKLYGGDGTPASRNAQGQPIGPGGRVFGGRGPDCTAELDHCLREGVWFAVSADMKPGKLYRAMPVFELEGKWWNWLGREETPKVVYKTKVAAASDLKPGNPVIFFLEETSAPKWVTSEYDSLTSSRWDIAIIDSVKGSSFRVKGWGSDIPVDTARLIIQQRKGG